MVGDIARIYCTDAKREKSYVSRSDAVALGKTANFQHYGLTIRIVVNQPGISSSLCASASLREFISPEINSAEHHPMCSTGDGRQIAAFPRQGLSG